MRMLCLLGQRCMELELLNIANVLADNDVQVRAGEDVLYIDLPNGFGALEISTWNQDGEDSIQLLGGNFHTHGNIEAREYGLPNREVGILHLVQSIFSGRFKMVEVKLEDGSTSKTIWDEYAQSSFGHGDDFEYRN